MDLVLTRRVEYLQPPSLGAVLHFVHSRWTDRVSVLFLYSYLNANFISSFQTSLPHCVW